MAVPTVAAVCYGEPGAARAFGISTLITALAGGVAGYCVRPTYRDMGKREGLLLTALVWVVFSAFGMIPYMLAPTTHLSLSAAFFRGYERIFHYRSLAGGEHRPTEPHHPPLALHESVDWRYGEL